MSSIVFMTIEQVLEIHSRTLEAHGGAPGLRSRALLESAVFQPQQSAFGEDAYPTLLEKGVAYGVGLIKNHPFVDGNKRAGFACMATFLFLNGFRIAASAEEVERIVVGVAAGTTDREALLSWVEQHVRPVSDAKMNGEGLPPARLSRPETDPGL
jgi:death-on-curing protein